MGGFPFPSRPGGKRESEGEGVVILSSGIMLLFAVGGVPFRGRRRLDGRRSCILSSLSSHLSSIIISSLLSHLSSLFSSYPFSYLQSPSFTLPLSVFPFPFPSLRFPFSLPLSSLPLSYQSYRPGKNRRRGRERAAPLSRSPAAAHLASERALRPRFFRLVSP